MNPSKLIAAWKQLFSVLAIMCMSTIVSAASTSPGDLLVTNLDAGTLTEYTRQGTVVQKFVIPRSDPNFPDLRDLVQDANGKIYMYNGTFTPLMTTLNPTTGAISSLSFAGWSTVNNISYGGIAVLGKYVFATDMATGLGGGSRGIVRFNLETGSASRFATQFDFTDLTLGLDGLLYADASVYDPLTTAFIRNVNLQGVNDVRGRAVDAAGNIYAASWAGTISKHNSSGALLASLSTNQNLTDIDIDFNGNIVVGSRSGDVYLTDRNLSPFTSFAVDGPRYGPVVHVAFTASVPESASVELMLVGALVLIGMSSRKRQRRVLPPNDR